LATGFNNQVLRYGGTIFGGLGAFSPRAQRNGEKVDDELLVMVLEGASQEDWSSEIMLEAAASGGARAAAAARVIAKAYDEAATEMEEAA
jgi:hypothetical protein